MEITLSELNKIYELSGIAFPCNNGLIEKAVQDGNLAERN